MKLLTNSALYLFFEILNKALPFFLLPIITRYLSPSEYGLYALYQVAFSFLLPLVSGSLDIHITRNFFRVSKERLSEILGAILALLHIHLFMALIFVFALTVVWENPLGLPSEIVRITPLILFAQSLNGFNLTLLRNEENAKAYGIVQLVLGITNYLFALWLLIGLEKGWSSLVYGLLISHVLVSFVSFYRLKKVYKPHLLIAKIPFRHLYAISLPLIVHTFGSSLLFLSDRLFLQYMLGTKAVGLYAIGTQFGTVTMVVINAIILALNPWMFRSLAEKHRNIFIHLVGYMVLFAIIGLSVWYFSSLLFNHLVDPSFFTAKPVIFWISSAFIFRGWYQLYHNILVHEGKTGAFFYITSGAAVLNLGMNYLFIRANGMIGAAQSTTLAFLFMFVATYLYARKISEKQPLPH